jgi:hypothetical protein
VIDQNAPKSRCWLLKSSLFLKRDGESSSGLISAFFKLKLGFAAVPPRSLPVARLVAVAGKPRPNGADFAVPASVVRRWTF